MPKGDYKSRRDRRKPQGGLPVGIVRGMYQLRRISETGVPGLIIYQAVVRDRPDGGVVTTDLLRMWDGSEPLGIEVKVDSVVQAITVSALVASQIRINGADFTGFVEVFVVPAQPWMRSGWGLDCMGAVDSCDVA